MNATAIGGESSCEKAQDILKQAATALAFMNAKGWIHRDVKPDNILVNSAGECAVDRFRPGPASRERVWQVVSPQVKAAGDAQLHVAGADSRPLLDGRADMYSFGATAFELVTGRPPFRAAYVTGSIEPSTSSRSPCRPSNSNRT